MRLLKGEVCPFVGSAVVVAKMTRGGGVRCTEVLDVVDDWRSVLPL